MRVRPHLTQDPCVCLRKPLRFVLPRTNYSVDPRWRRGITFRSVSRQRIRKGTATPDARKLRFLKGAYESRGRSTNYSVQHEIRLEAAAPVSSRKET